MHFDLLPYQRLMHDHLVAHDRAGLFAGIGLSKTATGIEAFRTHLADGYVKRALVVGPLRVANLTWPNELRKWDQFHGITFEHLRNTGDKPTGKAQICFTNYERLQRIPDLAGIDLVIFDELTKAKNPSSERINSLRPLLTSNILRWGFTGTPRPNSLLELFAQIRLLDDGKRLSPSFSHFQKTYFEPEDYNEYKWLPKPESERKIYEKIHDLVITLKSSDYLDIPDTVVEDIEVPLSKDAHGIYRELERELLAMVGDGSEFIVAVNAAVLVNKLLQVCSGAVYITDDPADAAGQIVGYAAQKRRVSHLHDNKLNALKRLLVDTKESALIACNFIHERDRICAAIPGAVDAHKFDGDIEDAWNSGSIKYLIADPRGLGHGLNLQQGGRDVVWFSPCHSRELYDQLNGRLARKGQDRVPRVFRLTSPGTMDDCVLETLRMRGDAQSTMMDILTNFRQQGLTFN